MATATLRSMARVGIVGFRGVRALSTTVASQASVGFIGLGNMGAHMARNLVKDGWCSFRLSDHFGGKQRAEPLSPLTGF
jgi:hypothetical protein